METPTNPAEAVVRAFLACFAAPELEEILAFFSENAVYQDPRPGALFEGTDALREEFRAQIRAVPSPKVTIRALVSDGTTVMLEREEQFEWNGRMIHMEGAQVFEVDESGKIRRMRDYYDRAQFAETPA